MRSLIGIAVLGAVIALAWEKPIGERVGEVIPAFASKQPPVAAKRATPAAATNSSGAWMWDPNRRTALDRPAYDAKERPPLLTDHAGRKYWVDERGKRHYER